MFICPDCGPRYNVDEFFQMFAPQSYGTCESCGKVAVCADIHHSRLTAPASRPPVDAPPEPTTSDVYDAVSAQIEHELDALGYEGNVDGRESVERIREALRSVGWTASRPAADTGGDAT